MEKPVKNFHFAQFVWFPASYATGPDLASLPLVLWRDFIDPDHIWLQDQRYRHEDFFGLNIVQQGQGTHIIDGLPYEISWGDVYLLRPGVTHQHMRCENLAMDSLYFKPEIFGAETWAELGDVQGFLPLFVMEPARPEAIGGERWLRLRPNALEGVSAEIDELRQARTIDVSGGPLLTRSLFLRLLIHLAQFHAATELAASAETLAEAEPSGTSPHEAIVAGAVRYLRGHFAEPLRIEQVAAAVFYSPDRLTRIFADALGRTPRDYLRHLRLERAKALLMTTDASITIIAQESGFGDAAYFSRVFRAATGLTPREFRAREL